MAGPCSHHSLHRNPFLGGEKKLVKGLPGAPTKGSTTSTLSLTIFWAQTPALALAPALAPSSIRELCQQPLKTYTAIVKLLKQNHRSGSCKPLFKAWFYNFYYRNLYIDCYHFYQQCKDYFKTTGASRFNYISIASLFFCGAIVQR